MTTEARIILCPGQGAQKVGMGKAWFDASPEAAQTFGAADQALGERFGRKLSEICFTGDEQTLNRTDIAQPAIYTVSVASHQALVSKDGDAEQQLASPDAAAGLSLGEYTALHLAGVFGFREGLELVALRGRAMQDAAQAAPSGMVALIGADESQARALCDDAAQGDVLVPANFNAPGQVVVSGGAAACDRALEAAEKMGLRAQRLPVAGAFHSPLMAPAADRLAAALEKVEMTAPTCPVLSNVTAAPHAQDADRKTSIIEQIKRRLIEQLTSPVRWRQCCQWLIDHQSGAFHELAPGKTLAGLMRRIDRSAKVQTHDEPDA